MRRPSSCRTTPTPGLQAAEAAAAVVLGPPRRRRVAVDQEGQLVVVLHAAPGGGSKASGVGAGCPPGRRARPRSGRRRAGAGRCRSGRRATPTMPRVTATATMATVGTIHDRSLWAKAGRHAPRAAWSLRGTIRRHRVVGAARSTDRRARLQLGGGLVAVLGRLGHGPQHDLLQAAGGCRPAPGGGQRAGGDVLEGDGHVGVAGERRPAAQHLVEHHAQGVDVGPAVDRLARRPARATGTGRCPRSIPVPVRASDGRSGRPARSPPPPWRCRSRPPSPGRRGRSGCWPA